MTGDNPQPHTRFISRKETPVSTLAAWAMVVMAYGLGLSLLISSAYALHRAWQDE